MYTRGEGVLSGMAGQDPLVEASARDFSMERGPGHRAQCDSESGDCQALTLSHLAAMTRRVSRPRVEELRPCRLHGLFFDRL
jgi:hypothetical protein